MTLLTNIYNLKTKYKTTSSSMAAESEKITSLMKQSGAAQKKYATAFSGYEKSSRSFVKQYGTQSDLDTFKAGETDLGGVGDAFYQRQVSEFRKQPGAGYYYQWQNMMSQPNPSFIAAQELMKRAGGAFDAYKRIVKAPMEAMQASYKGVQSDVETANLAQEEYTGYTDQISQATSRLEAFGASRDQISVMLSDAERMYGYSTEQRKRGTRGSSQRRSMLTSRSGYA